MMFGPGMMGSFGGWGFIWMIVGFAFIIAIIIGVILLIVSLTRRAGEGGGSTTTSSDALDIAKNRYARGEISKEEFDRIKKDIS